MLKRSQHFSQQQKKILTLSALGGMLEFYDFMIYGVFAVYFADQFFPAKNLLLSVIESYIVFFLGYLARPIGGVIFSHVGDEKGRKKVLVITIVLMGFSSLGVGLLPTYDQVGIIAPLALLLLRLLQGLALGGELPTTYVYINETITQNRGYAFGVTMVGVNGGVLLGMILNQLLTTWLSQSELMANGWRVPFILGGMLCLVSYKVRKTLQETAAFQKIRDKPQLPILYLLRHHWGMIFAGSAIAGIMSSLVVAVISFMPTYLNTFLHVDNRLISAIMTVGMVMNLIAIYVIGRLADYYRPHVILNALLLACVFLIPLGYILIAEHYFAIGTVLLTMLEGIAAILIPFIVSCLFPTKIRLTGVATCYNLGFTIFGGLAPVIIGSAIKAGAGIYFTPIAYFLAIIIICALGVVYAKRHSYEAI